MKTNFHTYRWKGYDLTGFVAESHPGRIFRLDADNLLPSTETNIQGLERP